MTWKDTPLGSWERGCLEIWRPCAVQRTEHHMPNLRELWRAWSQLVFWSLLLCQSPHKCAWVHLCKSMSGGHKTQCSYRNCIDTLARCEWFPVHLLDRRWDPWIKGPHICFVHLLYSIDLWQRTSHQNPSVTIASDFEGADGCIIMNNKL